MIKPARPSGEPLFGREKLRLAPVQGLVLLEAVLGLYGWSPAQGASEPSARADAFIAWSSAISASRSLKSTEEAGVCSTLAG